MNKKEIVICILTESIMRELDSKINLSLELS